MKHEKDSNSTDSVGTAEFNQALSQQRAQSIKNPLVARGVDSTRIDVVCFYGSDASRNDILVKILVQRSKSFLRKVCEDTHNKRGLPI